jgi:DinB superfamily
MPPYTSPPDSRNRPMDHRTGAGRPGASPRPRLPNPPHEDLPPGVFDLDARPTLDEVLVVRQARMNSLKNYLAGVTAEDLVCEVTSPNGGQTSIRQCIQVVLREEWWHNQYAARDLTILERR